MKRIVIALCCSIMLPMGGPLAAQDTATFVETNSHNVFTGLFRSVWARLKTLNPAPKESARSTVLYTAGIRGAETTDTLLKPYWKDDLTQDEDFQAELERFSLAQHKMDQGELVAAIASFDSFLQLYPRSDLRPNAIFAKSISHAGLGQNELSLTTMQQFIDENPVHPLIKDARLVIDRLQ